MQKSGSISFYEDEDKIKKVKQLIFSGAFCVGYQEKFNAYNAKPYIINLTLSAGGVKIDEGVFRFPWFKGPLKGDNDEILETIIEYTSAYLPQNENFFTRKGINDGKDLPEEVDTEAHKGGSNATKGHSKNAPKGLITREHKLATIKKTLEAQKDLLEKRKINLERWNESDQDCFKKVFGNANETNRKTITERIDKQITEVDRFLKDDTYKQQFYKTKEDCYASVLSTDPDHKINLGKDFWDAPLTGEDSKAGVLVHEMSHFIDMGDTDDVKFGGSTAYGKEICQEIANDPLEYTNAIKNADNFEYYVEGAICE